ncbi:hypothetical protein ABMA10_19335 [Plantibacter sp. RU18]
MVTTWESAREQWQSRHPETPVDAYAAAVQSAGHEADAATQHRAQLEVAASSEAVAAGEQQWKTDYAAVERAESAAASASVFRRAAAQKEAEAARSAFEDRHRVAPAPRPSEAQRQAWARAAVAAGAGGKLGAARAAEQRAIAHHNELRRDPAAKQPAAPRPGTPAQEKARDVAFGARQRGPERQQQRDARLARERQQSVPDKSLTVELKPVGGVWVKGARGTAAAQVDASRPLAAQPTSCENHLKHRNGGTDDRLYPGDCAVYRVRADWSGMAGAGLRMNPHPFAAETPARTRYGSTALLSGGAVVVMVGSFVPTLAMASVIVPGVSLGSIVLERFQVGPAGPRCFPDAIDSPVPERCDQDDLDPSFGFVRSFRSDPNSCSDTITSIHPCVFGNFDRVLDFGVVDLLMFESERFISLRDPVGEHREFGIVEPFDGACVFLYDHDRKDVPQHSDTHHATLARVLPCSGNARDNATTAMSQKSVDC